MIMVVPLARFVHKLYMYNVLNRYLPSSFLFRVKTVRNALGRVADVTYENITLSKISQFGITVFGNYDLKRGGPEGEPTGGVPIHNLTLRNINGDVMHDGTNVWVYVANASNWNWDNIYISGGTKTRRCEGFPSELPPLC